jgi:5-methylcytosine-specific restriction endonuclease McrA
MSAKPYKSVMRQDNKTFSNAFRRWMFAKSGGTCEYCGTGIAEESDMFIDHVVARSLGGPHEENNLRAACQSCNSAKRDGDLKRLRDALRVRRSALYGVVSPKQVNQLEALGAVLPVAKSFVFAFERGRA